MKGGIVGSNVATLVPLVLLAGAGGLGSRYISDSVSGIATIEGDVLGPKIAGLAHFGQQLPNFL